MKKFTKIEEDLIKEAAAAHEVFDERYKKANDTLMQIKTALFKLSAEYYGDPTGRTKKNWGYAGDLAYINNLLDEALEVLINDDKI